LELGNANDLPEPDASVGGGLWSTLDGGALRLSWVDTPRALHFDPQVADWRELETGELPVDLALDAPVALSEDETLPSVLAPRGRRAPPGGGRRPAGAALRSAGRRLARARDGRVSCGPRSRRARRPRGSRKPPVGARPERRHRRGARPRREPGDLGPLDAA